MGNDQNRTGTVALAEGAVVTIDWNDTHQTIDGFGTSQGGGYAPTLYAWPEAQRNRIMDLAFSQANGIGLTIFRSAILPALEPSQGAFNDLSDPAQVWMMKEALRRSPVKLFASVWSPPAWMKTNGNTIRGELKTENYQDFADYLSHYAVEYARTNGVNVYAVSMTNEPDTTFDPSEQGWDTCTWNSHQIANFLGSFLSATFAANRVTAKVIAPEAANWNSVAPYLSDTYNNPTAAARVDIVAGHLYGGDPALVFHDALNHGKKIWQTEASLTFSAWDIAGAVSWATRIHESLTSAQVSAWVWWLLALWPDNQALISLDSPDGAFSVSKAMWALGNFSRFIRPGFVRIGAMTNGPLNTSAYRDPATGQFVIVAVNGRDIEIDVNFSTVGFTGGSVTPYVTSSTLDLAPQPAVSLANTVTVPAMSVVTYVSRPPTLVSYHRPDGLVLSTGNIYFTSHDALGAHVFRTGQTSSPDQEARLYSEPLGNQFGDIVWANVGGAFYGYFWARNSSGQSFIKRIPLSGSQIATVLTPPITNIDIVNSHHNLATDGVNLYWQEVSWVKKMPVGGGPITALDPTSPNTPTAGVYFSNGSIIYASVAAVRHVPTSGALTGPEVRTIVTANAPVSTILPVSNGVYWGDRRGAIQLQVGTTISTIQPGHGRIPTSIGTNGFTAGGALVWTQCGSTTCEVSFSLPGTNWTSEAGGHALGALMISSGNAFWADDYGLHRLF